jgi:hypothetical protein
MPPAIATSNRWRLRSRQREPDAEPQHSTGTGTGKRKEKRKSENPYPTPPRSEKRGRHTDPEPSSLQDWRHPVTALIQYEVWLALKTVGHEVETIDELATRCGFERHWFPRAKQKFAEQRHLDRKPGSGRPLGATQKMVEGLKEFAAREKHIFTYDQATCALERAGWTRSTLWRYVQSHWNVKWPRLKPELTAEHKLARSSFAKKFLGWGCWAEVHLDEKLWYTVGRRLMVKYPPGREDAQFQHVPNKKKSPKICVLAVMARPNAHWGFDGRICIVRVAQKKIAQRASKNHKRGDIYDVDCNLIADIFFEIMTDQVFPAIRQKLQWLDAVAIRLDGATPHTGHGNIEKLNEVGKIGRPLIKVVRQPVKSPDTNILDGSIFPSMSSRTCPIQKFNRFWDQDELWKAVQQVWDEYDAETIERAWQNRDLIFSKIIENDGGNEFEVPHVSAAVRDSRLPGYGFDASDKQLEP